EAARRGAETTVGAVARRGRASYLGERAQGYPDPGAVGVVRWLEAVAGSRPNTR
ncbi:DAK2 domain-containing protein, partial [Raineyella sp.]|uniref:DAK2 domain-containing protein n=1 Tax=Raineyella sp. TaxID=1911550 RepID=UPI002B211F46